MSITVNDKNLGHATAYAYAKSAGYTGTEAEFAELLGNIADDLSEIENLRATATTLPAGSAATASYADGVLTLGIPKGDKGDKGDTGAQGPKGDTGEVSYAEFNPVVADVTQLKSDLAEPKASKNNKLSLSLQWQQGAYNPNTGGGSSSNTRIRSPYFVPFKGFIRFTVPDGYKLFWYRYDYWNYASISGHSGTWKTGVVQINDDGRLYKIALAKSDDSTITPAEAPSVGVEIGGEANTLTPSNTEYLNTEILSILSVYKTLRVPQGDFTLTAPIVLADDHGIIGDGFGSVVRLADSVSDSAIKLASNNIIQNLQIVGRSEDYTVETAPSTMGSRHGILFTGSVKRGIVDNCLIHGFDGFGIYCFDTSTASNQGLSVKDCYLIGNYGGFYARRSEFHRISGIDCNNCYIGAEIDGGNITVNGSNFSSNQIGMSFDNEDGSASNNTHGEVVGCIIQHSRQNAVKVNNMASGEMFVGCNIDNGGVSLIKAYRFLFSGCNFMNAFSIDITDGGLIHFADCMIRDYTKEHTTVTNNTAVKFTNCFDVSGNLFDPVA